MSWSSAVNDFWFVELSPEDWFKGGPDLDARITRRFESLYDEQRRTLALAATLDAVEHLAAVVLFDQFPRNMYRGTANSFGTDARALALSRHAIEAGLDKGLSIYQRQFLYMPFMHSEDARMQQQSLALFKTIGLPEALVFAVQHKEVIDRFGRFPQRNKLLGRPSTPEEQEFLATTKYEW